jgi:hypothetical protein
MADSLTEQVLAAVRDNHGRSAVELCKQLKIPRENWSSVSTILYNAVKNGQIFRVDSLSTRTNNRVWRYWPEVPKL